MGDVCSHVLFGVGLVGDYEQLTRPLVTRWHFSARLTSREHFLRHRRYCSVTHSYWIAVVLRENFEQSTALKSLWRAVLFQPFFYRYQGSTFFQIRPEVAPKS